MGAYTPRAGLYKPGGGSTGLILPDETVDIDKLNANFDIVDSLLGARNVPSAASYAGTMDGDLVYAQDTEYLHMYSAGAGALVTPRLPGATRFAGTNAERSATIGRDGDSWWSTEDKSLAFWVSGAWKGAAPTLTPAANVTFTLARLELVAPYTARLTLNANRSPNFVNGSEVLELPPEWRPSGVWTDIISTTLNSEPKTVTLRLDNGTGKITTIGFFGSEASVNIRGAIDYPLPT